MFRFGKDMEYALIALVGMGRFSQENLISARELSDRYSLPYKLLARILQQLSSGGVVHAVMGPKGGYKLARTPEEISLGTVIRAVRGKECIADCLSEEGGCVREQSGCIIKPAVRMFQEQWMCFVENTTLDEFFRADPEGMGEKDCRSSELH